MKLSLVVNASGLAVIAVTIAASVIELGGAGLESVREAQRNVTEIRLRTIELTREVASCSVVSESDRGWIGLGTEHLASAVARLGETMSAPGVDREARRLLGRIRRDAESFRDDVERFRSQAAIHANTGNTLPVLLRGLVEDASTPPELRAAAAGLLAELPLFVNAELVNACEAAEAVIEAIDTGLAASGVVEDAKMRWRLARAQIEQLVASTWYLRHDMDDLVAATSDPIDLVRRDLVDEWVRDRAASTDVAIRRLLVASASLLAFVSAGVWQFRGQARALAVANAELETRVRERTRELSRSQEFLKRVLDVLPSKVCILDGDGRLVGSNARWDRFAAANGWGADGEAMNYLVICRESLGEDAKDSRRLADAIRRVACGNGQDFETEALCRVSSGERWFQIAATALPRSEVGCVVVTHTCITERVLAEKQLAQSKEEAELLALVAKHTENAVVITDASGRAEWVNDAFTRMTGYEREEILGRKPGNLLQGASTNPATVNYMRRRIARREGFTAELINYKRSGEEYWLSLEVRPITDAAGAVTRFISIENNITDRKLAEYEMRVLNEQLERQNASLAAEQRLLDTIVNSVHQAIFWKGDDGRFLGCNRAFAEAVGLKNPRDIRGLTDYDLNWSREHADSNRECDRRVMRREIEVVNAEESLVNAAGDERLLWTSKTPLEDEQRRVVGMVGVLADVTEVRRAQLQRDRLMTESAELARVIRESPQEVYIFSQETLRFLEVNAGARRSTGYAAEELVELTPLDLKPRFDLQAFQQLIEPLASGAVGALDFGTVHRRKDGSEYPAQISLHSAHYKDTPVFVAFVTDQTENERLRQRLGQAQKLESLGQLSAGLAHEINTPMQFIGDNIEYLSESSQRLFAVVDRYREFMDEGSPLRWAERREEIMRLERECRFDHIRAQVPGAIEECREGVKRTVKIVKAMKAFSHPGGAEAAPVDLNDAVESTVAVSRNRWKYAAELDLELDPDLPQAALHAAEINQVLLNLMVNAADAVVERHGDERIGRIVVRTRRLGDEVAVEVEDDGCGIPDSIRSKVFDPFFTTKDVGRGTGQGLAIVHSIVVNLHGGRIEIESEPGVGTLFRLLLPISASTAKIPSTDSGVVEVAPSDA